MPIYEYRCANCDRSFEAFVRPGDDGAQCPHCHGSKLTREMSTFAARGSNGDAAAAVASAMANLRHVERRRLHRRRMLRWRLRLSLIVALAHN